MQAIILATHENRTLPPLTDTMPGALLPVVDRPVMAMTVEILARAGQKRILVSLYNQGGSIASYFGSGKRWGVDLEYVAQRESWGSAGALRWAAGLLDETFLVLPGDQVLDVDVEAALAFHRAHGGPATVILHPSLAESQIPLLMLGPDNHVATQGTPYAVTGGFLFEPRVLEYIAPRTQADICADLLPALVAQHEPVHGFVMDGYWNPLNSLAAFHTAQQVVLYSAVQEKAPDLASGGPSERVRYPALSSRQIVPGVWVGPNHSIHPSVKIAAPVYIGDNCYIGREVEIGAGTVIGSNVVIDDEATVSGSTILRETYVGQLVKVEGRIVTASTISDPESGATTQVVDPFLLSRVGTRHEGPHRLALYLTRALVVAMMVLLGPLFILLFLLTTIVTLGRPIARHLRVGQRITNPDGTPGLYEFYLLNFRTRRRNGRYTLLGRWMERWELQRLPELVNVFRGDLALVGVKPLAPDQAALLTEEWHQKRHDAQAGLTGLWYQQTDASSDLDTVIIADVYYTATRTWRSDVFLFLRTPAIWMRRNMHQQRSNAMIHADHVGNM
ncbi:nucleotidyl transferase [Oscillochloris trichoides DG-6]|uniref:Nucleotidyl transferase n=1 Tax=Oscillochloris trichoides DG-6 TaxID=765420 RepID=E1I9N2_9CHLR|nr:sugar phosphate nucleotidyltransferase [Oscillochloris trichoides]EFO82110.1 nucleotidyl transferase [Oscillochloris trichoides DG-6]